uniref:ANK_REP_REGION domain-containing protein n=1 Tax=Rhabditophanes sp. KR3021 TaxID=114890 RepID=A0AC35TVF9_9BILA
MKFVQVLTVFLVTLITCSYSFNLPSFSHKNCKKFKCHPSSNCKDTNDGPICVCAKNRKGIFCEFFANICLTENPCKNNSICYSDEFTGKINCWCDKSKYSGKFCEIKVDMCASNGKKLCGAGSCVTSETSGYECKCPENVTGSHCEIAKVQNITEDVKTQEEDDKLESVTVDKVKLPYSQCFDGQFCKNVSNNNICNNECNTEACLFDGNDCIEKKAAKNLTEFCYKVFGDNICNEECNISQFQFDGSDCVEKTNVLSGEIILILNTTVDNFNSKKQKYFADMSNNLRVTVKEKFDSDVKVVNVTNIKISITVDTSSCISSIQQQCFTNLDSIADFINNDKQLFDQYGVPVYEAYQKRSSSQISLNIPVFYQVVAFCFFATPMEYMTQLHYYCDMGITLSMNLPINITDVNTSEPTNGDKPLHTLLFSKNNSCENTLIGNIRFLVSNNCNIEGENKLGQTPLIIAVKYRLLKVAQELIILGANVNAKDNDSFTSLMHCAMNGDIEMGKLLLKNRKLNINAFDSYGRSALTLAIISDMVNVLDFVELLQKHSIDADNVGDQKCMNFSGKSALHYAVEFENTELIKLLCLGSNANVNIVTLEKKTPLMMACEKGSMKVVNTLTDCKADPLLKDKYGSTAADLAMKNHPHIAEYLNDFKSEKSEEKIEKINRKRKSGD